MPVRILREGILTSERVALLSWPEEVFYRRLMSVVDDFGRYFAQVTLLRAACYPLQLDKVSDSDVGKWLLATEKAGLVRVYPAQDGKRYVELLNFKQQVRAKASKFPGPASDCQAAAQQLLSNCLADAKQMIATAHLDGDGDGDGDDFEEADASSSSAGPTKKRAAKTANCPVAEIVGAYHEVLPEWPRAKVMLDARVKAIKAMWRWVMTSTKSDGLRRAETAEQGMEWFRQYFARVRANDFLMGRTPRSADHANWRPDIDYLMTDRGLKQVIEKTTETT
jgi:hypothetical protein